MRSGLCVVCHSLSHGKVSAGLVWSTAVETVDSIFLLGLADSLFQTTATVAWAGGQFFFQTAATDLTTMMNGIVWGTLEQ
jgi:hypothetical protein